MCSKRPPPPKYVKQSSCNEFKPFCFCPPFGFYEGGKIAFKDES